MSRKPGNKCKLCEHPTYGTYCSDCHEYGRVSKSIQRHNNTSKVRMYTCVFCNNTTSRKEHCQKCFDCYSKSCHNAKCSEMTIMSFCKACFLYTNHCALNDCNHKVHMDDDSELCLYHREKLHTCGDCRKFIPVRFQYCFEHTKQRVWFVDQVV
jgi:hypothetical protein